MTVPELSEQEQDSILRYLSGEAKRRRQSRAKMLKVMAHGTEYARLHADEIGPRYCDLPEGVKLIEIWVEEDGGDILVATHWVHYTEWLGIAAAKATISLANNRELELVITPIPDRPGSALLVLTCRPTSIVREYLSRIRALAPRPWLLRFSLGVTSLVAVGWIIGSFTARRELFRQRATVEQIRQQLVQEKAHRESLQQELNERKPASAEIYRLTPDDVLVRNSEQSRKPVIRFMPDQLLAIIELPVAQQTGQQYRAVLTEFQKHGELLSEVLPVEGKRKRSTVEFQLPSNLVQDGKYYVITLSYANHEGTIEPYRTFTFLVVKQLK